MKLLRLCVVMLLCALMVLPGFAETYPAGGLSKVLANTTLATPVTSNSDAVVYLASVTGVAADTYLYVDSELMLVTSVNASNKSVAVTRGFALTTAALHVSGAAVRVQSTAIIADTSSAGGAVTSVNGLTGAVTAVTSVTANAGLTASPNPIVNTGTIGIDPAADIVVGSLTTTGTGPDLFAVNANPGSPVNGNFWYTADGVFKYYDGSTIQTIATPPLGQFITYGATGAPANYEVLTAGPGVTLTPDAGAHTMTVAAAGTSPAAPDTSVQFNDGGAFAGETAFTWNKTTKKLQVLVSDTASHTVLNIVDNSTTLGADAQLSLAAQGAEANADFYGASTGSLDGFTVSATNGTGSVTLMTGLDVAGNSNAGGTVALNSGIEIDDQHGVGTVNAGLYIVNQGSGANDYAIKVDGGKSDFEGPIMASSSVGTSGQVLTSQGAGVAAAWTSPATTVNGTACTLGSSCTIATTSDPATTLSISDEFMGHTSSDIGGTDIAQGEVGELGWSRNSFGGAVASGPQYGNPVPANHPGIYTLTAQAAGSVNYLELSQNASAVNIFDRLDNKTFDATWIVDNETFAGGSVIRVGMTHTSGAAQPSDGMYFEVTDAGNWKCVTRASSVETSTDSGVAKAAATWYRLRITNDGAGNVKFYVNGVLKATNATNVPTNSQAAFFEIAGDGNLTSDNVLYIDYFGMSMTVVR